MKKVSDVNSGMVERQSLRAPASNVLRCRKWVPHWPDFELDITDPVAGKELVDIRNHLGSEELKLMNPHRTGNINKKDIAFNGLGLGVGGNGVTDNPGPVLPKAIKIVNFFVSLMPEQLRNNIADVNRCSTVFGLLIADSIFSALFWGLPLFQIDSHPLASILE